MITQIDTTIERLNTEADLCRNEGADDIANLLSETADLLTLIKKDPVRVLEFAHSYSDDHVRVFVNDQPAHRVDLLPATEQAPVQLAPSRTGRVYVAGPMTGIKDFNFPAFNQAADELRTLGLTVLNPADHGVVDGAEWADYLRHDIALLSTCERIHLLPGWPKSKGARLELHIAQTLGMEVTTAPGAELVHCDVSEADFGNTPERKGEVTSKHRPSPERYADMIKETMDDDFVIGPAFPATPERKGEPVYQYQCADGSWIDQKKDSYDYNVKHGHATVRVLYTSPQVPEDVQRKANAWGYLHGTTKLQMDGGDRDAWVMFHRLEHIHKTCPQNVEIDAARKGE